MWAKLGGKVSRTILNIRIVGEMDARNTYTEIYKTVLMYLTYSMLTEKRISVFNMNEFNGID